LTVAEAKAGKFIPIGVRDTSLPISVMIWGDSHAMAIVPAFDAYLKEVGLRGCVATHSATAPVLNYYRPQKALRSRSIPFSEAVVSYIERNHIPNVVLAAAWKGYKDPDEGGSAEVLPSIVTTIKRLRSIGTQPWIVLDIPGQEVDVPRVFARKNRKVSIF